MPEKLKLLKKVWIVQHCTALYHFEALSLTMLEICMIFSFRMD